MRTEYSHFPFYQPNYLITARINTGYANETALLILNSHILISSTSIFQTPASVLLPCPSYRYVV